MACGRIREGDQWRATMIRNKGKGFMGYYLLASANELTGSPLLFQNFVSEIILPFS